MPAPAAADSDSDDFEMGATVPAPRAALTDHRAVFARAASDVTVPRTIQFAASAATRARRRRQLGRHLAGWRASPSSRR